jgi:ArsR family transcriptional regulator
MTVARQARNGTRSPLASTRSPQPDNICMRMQSRKPRAITPRQAASRRHPIDNLLNPELFKALCDPTRTSLLACLAKCARPCTVSEIAQCCSVDFSVVSRHLSTLARAGVLEARKQGRTVLYRMRYADLSAALRSLADAIDQCCPSDCSAPGDCCSTFRRRPSHSNPRSSP